MNGAVLWSLLISYDCLICVLITLFSIICLSIKTYTLINSYGDCFRWSEDTKRYLYIIYGATWGIYIKLIHKICFKVLMILNFTKNTCLQRIVPFISMARHEGLGSFIVFLINYVWSPLQLVLWTFGVLNWTIIDYNYKIKHSKSHTLPPCPSVRIDE